MKLYYAPASSYSQRVLVALYEKNTEFTPIVVNLGDSSERARYRALAPFGKVPLLDTDRGLIPEASIIIQYLDLIHPGSKLVPDDALLALEVRLIERIVDVYLNGGRQAVFDEAQRAPEQRRPDTIAKGRSFIELGCRALEARLLARQWLGGDSFSLADCAAAATFAQLGLLFRWQRFARLHEYTTRLADRPSVARVRRETADATDRMLATLPYSLPKEDL